MTEHADVAIVGAGVIGLCSAYYLRQLGYEVTIFDQHTVGSGSSHGNAGLIPPSHSIPLAAPGVMLQGFKWMLDPQSPFYIKPRLDPELFSWLWRFRAACRDGPMRKAIPVLRDLIYTSRDLYRELIEEENLTCDFEQRGVLMLYNSEAGFNEGVHEADLLRTHGVFCDALDAPAARQVEPAIGTTVVGALHFRDDAHLNPSRFMEELSRRVTDLGVRIYTDSPVIDFVSKHSGRARRLSALKTAQQTMTADQFVLATGAWSGPLAKQLNLPLPIQPAKGYSITMARPLAGPDYPLIAHERKVAITPMGDLLRVAGTLEMSGLNLDIDQRRVRAIQQAADEYLQMETDIPPQNVWVGMRPLTPDGLPIIERSSAVNNVVIATGHAMLGMAMGPVTGKLVSQLIAREEPVIELYPLRSDRWH